ncbi:MAG: hypothetical protein HRU03_06135 [Nanoarchaeales archaeon]|nr:hypothetical protein [Nanoarchaeales archaeon]
MNMDDEFILVSKSELDSLKQNKQAPQVTETKSESKNKIKDSSKKQEISTDILEQFRKIIREENKIEKEQIISDLSNIKDLGKSTLSSVLEKTDKLDTRIETLVNAISELVGTVKDLVEEHPKDVQDNTAIINEIKNLKTNSSENSHKEIKQKLEEIDEFMKNLKILLSQIKPSNMSM